MVRYCKPNLITTVCHADAWLHHYLRDLPRGAIRRQGFVDAD
jgi:hypothetical protein